MYYLRKSRKTYWLIKSCTVWINISLELHRIGMKWKVNFFTTGEDSLSFLFCLTCTSNLYKTKSTILKKFIISNKKGTYCYDCKLNLWIDNLSIKNVMHIILDHPFMHSSITRYCHTAAPKHNQVSIFPKPEDTTWSPLRTESVYQCYLGVRSRQAETV